MMKIRGYASLPFLAACATLAACSSVPEPEPDLAARLARDTGVAWTVYVDPRSHEVRFLAPASPVRVGNGTPEETARAFFARYRDSLHASAKGVELRPASVTTDRRGDLHLRFEHVLPGTELPVFDSGTTAHFTPDGAVTWLLTDFHAELESVDPTPTISREAAIAAAIAHVEASCGAVGGLPTASGGELGVLADEESKPALAYRVTLDVTSERCVAPAVFVDARTGAPRSLEERAHSVDGLVRGSHSLILDEPGDVKVISVSVDATSPTTRYRMITDTNAPGERKVRTHTYPSGAVLASRNVVDWDDLNATGRGSAVDAHYFTSKAIEFLQPFADGFDSHNRMPILPLARDVDVFVHYNVGPSFGANASATFDRATGRDIVRFGDGNRAAVKNALPFSAAFDVVAHEVAHLITAHTSKLKYAGESGALNESFSDVMGASAEHWLSPNDNTNFVIGERLFFRTNNANERTALRDMENPGSVSPGQPAHTEDRYKCRAGAEPDPTANDYCGVHTNSGIPNRAFVLQVEGGEVISKLGKVGVPRGVGWEKATESWYWALTGLDKSAGFEVAAMAQIVEAGRFGIEEALQAVCSWYAVGVLPATHPLVLATFGQCVAPPAPERHEPPKRSSDAPAVTTICSGHGNHTVCDPTVPSLAAVCAAGEIVSASTCADLGMRCKPASASDPTATLDLDGALVCE